MKVSDFLNNDLVDYASYSTVRMIGSAIDGQKNAARKIVKTILDKNIKKEIKVSQLGSKASEYTEYLHGDICGVIVTMAQNYSGTNNLPLLDREGNFGTRFIPEASASRYIYTNGSKEMFELFNKDDLNILEKQYFEGEEIEPKFYLPCTPLILVNGSEGIATGFAQKILPRNPELIKNYLISKLNKTNSKTDKTFTPWFKDFTGEVIQGENPKQWIIKGKVQKISITKVLITELPVGYSLKSYISILNKLEDNKVITSFKDKSEKDFRFEVSMLSSNLKKLSINDLLVKLKLIKTVTENYTCIDEFSKIKEFNDVSEVFDYYYSIKLKYLQKRKDYLIKTIKESIQLNYSKYLFIKNIVEDKLIINKRTKDEIIKDLSLITDIQVYDNYDYLLNMRISSLTKEKMIELEDSLRNLKKKFNIIKTTSLQDLWKDEL